MKLIPYILSLAVLMTACQPLPPAGVLPQAASLAPAETQGPAKISPADTLAASTALPATPSPIPPTPTQEPPPVISPANVASLHLVQLAGLGYPKALRYTTDGRMLLYVGSRGACYYNPDDLAIDRCFFVGTLEQPDQFIDQQQFTSTQTSADGRWLMEQYQDMAGVRSLADGQNIFGVRPTLDRFLSGQISSTGRYMAAFSVDSAVVPYQPVLDVWDIAQNKHIASLAEISSFPWLAAFSPDEQLLMVKTSDLQFRIWDFENNQLSEPFLAPGPIIAGAVFSPDGQLLAISSNGPVANGQTEPTGNGNVRVYRLSDGEAVWGGQAQGPLREAAFSPDGRLFAFASQSKAIRVYSTADWQAIKNVQGSAPYGYKELKFSPSGSFLIANPARPPGMNFSGLKQIFNLSVWNITSGTKAAEFEGGAAAYDINTVDFSPDEKSFALVTPFDLSVYTLDPLVKAASVPIQAVPSASAYTPDGKTLLTSFQGGQLMAWNVAEQRFTGVIGEVTPELVGEYFHPFSFLNLEVSPDGRFAAASGRDVPLRVWDLLTRTNLADYFNGENVVDMRFSPDGSRLAVLTGQETIATGNGAYSYLDVFLHVIQLPSGEVTEPFQVFGRQRYFGDHNRYKTFFAGTAGELKLLSILKDTDYATYVRSDLKVTDLDACMAAGRSMADCPSRLLEAPFTGKSYFCTLPQINADGSRLGARCGELYNDMSATDFVVWDLDSGKILNRFYLCPNDSGCGITAMTLSPDWRLLAIGFQVDRVGSPKIYQTKVWDTEKGDLVYGMEGMSPMLFSPDGRYLSFLVNPVQIWRAESQ